MKRWQIIVQQRRRHCELMEAALEEVKHDSSCVKVAEKIPCFAAKKLFWLTSVAAANSEAVMRLLTPPAD